MRVSLENHGCSYALAGLEGQIVREINDDDRPSIAETRDR